MAPYIRAGIYPINEVLPFIISSDGFHRKDSEKDYDGHIVRMDSLRYRVFASKGAKCAKCGIEGKYFALEKDKHADTTYWHFNLYALNKENHEVLMTKNHIDLTKQEDKNSIDNLQTTCIECNHKSRKLLKEK